MVGDPQTEIKSEKLIGALKVGDNVLNLPHKAAV